DAAYNSGSLIFNADCGPDPVCVFLPPPSGWVSGFQFPAFDSVAWVALTFEPGGLLSGSLHVSLNSDQAYTYAGDGLNWTAIFIDGVETFTETGFYQRVPEPAALSLLSVGL